MEFSDRCPTCGKALQLQQINFETALLMCLDSKCPYPCSGECWVIKRNIQDINKRVDLYKQLQKQGMLRPTPTSLEQLLDTSALLDLEDLLSSELNSHNEEQLSHKAETYQQNNSKEKQLEELNAFLDDLLT